MDSRSFYRALTITLVVGAVALSLPSFGLRDTIHQLSGLLLFVLFFHFILYWAWNPKRFTGIYSATAPFCKTYSIYP